MTRRRVIHPNPLKPFVSASELARMGLCERMVAFEHRFGQRLSPDQRAATARGQHAHAQFFQEGRRAPSEDHFRSGGLRSIAEGLVAKLRHSWRRVRGARWWFRMPSRVR